MSNVPAAAKHATFHHVRRQFAVGHGFFHAGSIKRTKPAARLDYVYDCGSKTKAERERAIDEYEALNKSKLIQLLVVSHLHSDHVNGVDLLFQRMQHISWVVVPFLHPEEIVALAADALSTGSLDTDRVELLTDPTSWFTRRGADRVLLVGNGDDPGFDAPQRPEESQDKSRLKIDGSSRRTRDGSETSMTHDTNVVSDDLQWLFRFYCYRDVERRAQFAKIIRKLCTTPPTATTDMKDWLRERMRSAKARKELIACYGELVGKNFNSTSLCMYSGPTRRPGLWRSNGRPVAWLGTGDATLKQRDVADEFFEHFATPELAPVGSVSLPHHGSKDNFNPRLLTAFPHANFYVTCPARSDHHPDSKVAKAFRKSNRPLHKVTERGKTGLMEEWWVSPHYATSQLRR